MSQTKEIKVDSSTVDTVSYDKEKKTLFVTFKSKGLQYKYSPVEETTFLEMLAAPSVGKYLNENIKKNDAIEYQKVTE